MNELEDWLSKNGLNFTPNLNGEINRFVPDGRNDKRGWYVGSEETLPNGKRICSITVSDWETDEKLYFRSGGFNNGDLDKYKEQVAKRSKDVEREKEKRHEEAAKKAVEIWERSTREASPSGQLHEYLKRKKISLSGARIFEGKVTVPLTDMDGKITGLQFISENGDKRFLPGTRKRGCYFFIPGTSESGVATVAEGYATGCSVHEATGFPVYIAFDAGNLRSVAENIKSSEGAGRKQVIICADNDQWREGGRNIGVEKAMEASLSVGGLIAIPHFPVLFDTTIKPTDWNDLHVLYGIEEVRRQIDEQVNGSGKDRTANEKDNDGKQPPREPKTKNNNGSNGEYGGNTNDGKAGKSKKKKISQEEIEVLGREILDCRFKLYVDNGTTVLYDITNINKKELSVCQNEEFLLRRLKKNILEKWGKPPAVDFVKIVYSSWRACTETLKKQPASFVWQDQDEWSFKKLDFVPQEGSFESWKEFLYRLSSPDDFMAFIWSIFEPKNTSRQFLYMSDPIGEGGKSTVIGILGGVFGNSFASISNQMISGAGLRWLMGQLYGKRLVAWPDCKNPKFCMSELVRNITSGDSVSVEFKGQHPFSTEMYLKLIIGSNHEPQITSGGADTSRLIHIHVAENKERKDDPNWKDRLKAELPYFLWECKRIYAERCPNHGKIVLADKTRELVDASTDSIEERFHSIVEQCVEFSEFSQSTAKEVSYMAHCNGLSDQELGNFKEYLKRVHNIKITRKKPDKSKPNYRPTCYLGMRVKQPVSENYQGDADF